MVVKITETNLNAYKQLFQEAFNYLKEKKLLREIDKNLTTFTTLEHYFSYIEILKHNSHFLLNTPISDSFIVDPSSKIIKAPNSFSNHAIIQTDSGVDMITFKIDRFFGSIDLANATAFVQWTAPDETGVSQRELASSCQIDLLDETNMIKVGWIINNDITEYPGDLLFSLTFFIKDPEKPETDIIRLNTQPVKINIKPALHKTVGLNWIDPYDKIESAIVNNKYTGKMPIPQSPKFSGAGYDLPVEANLLEDTLTLKAQAYVLDLGAISYQWKFVPFGENRALKCSPIKSERNFICKSEDYISEIIYDFLTPESQAYFELVKVNNEYKYRLIKAEDTTVYYEQIGEVGTIFEKINTKNFKPTAGEEYYSPKDGEALEKEIVETEIFYAESARLSVSEYEEIDSIQIDGNPIPMEDLIPDNYFSRIVENDTIKGYLVIHRDGITIKTKKEEQYKKVYYEIDSNKFKPVLGEDISNLDNIYEKFSIFTIPKAKSEEERQATYTPGTLISRSLYNKIKYIIKDDKKVNRDDLAEEYFTYELKDNPIKNEQLSDEENKIVDEYEVKTTVKVEFKEEDVVGSYQVFAKNTVSTSYIDKITNEERPLTNSSFEQGSQICQLLSPTKVIFQKNLDETVFLEFKQNFKLGDFISEDDFKLIINEEDKTRFRSTATGYEFKEETSATILLRKTQLKVSGKNDKNDRGSVSYSWKYSKVNPEEKPLEASLSNDSGSPEQIITEPGWYKVVATSTLNRKEIKSESDICRVLLPQSQIKTPTLQVKEVKINDNTKEIKLTEDGYYLYSVKKDDILKIKVEALISNDGLDDKLISDNIKYYWKIQVAPNVSPKLIESSTGDFEFTVPEEANQTYMGLTCSAKNVLNEVEGQESESLVFYLQ